MVLGVGEAQGSVSSSAARCTLRAAIELANSLPSKTAVTILGAWVGMIWGGMGRVTPRPTCMITLAILCHAAPRLQFMTSTLSDRCKDVMQQAGSTVWVPQYMLDQRFLGGATK